MRGRPSDSSPVDDRYHNLGTAKWGSPGFAAGGPGSAVSDVPLQFVDEPPGA
jgi:hypothetical protein